MRILLAVLFGALVHPVAAAELTPGAVGLLVLEQDTPTITASLRDALTSADPAVRAAAGRVAAVRDLRDLLPDLRASLAAERDPVSAREILRAVALVGGPDELELLLATRERFAPLLDPSLADAVARFGSIDALRIYQEHLAPLERIDRPAFFHQALWERPQLAAVAGAKLLQTGDTEGWSALLSVLSESDVPLDPGLVAAGLASDVEAIEEVTTWYLVRERAEGSFPADERVDRFFDAEEDGAGHGSTCARFGREILRRMAGAPFGISEEYELWLDDDGSRRFIGKSVGEVSEWLSESEREALAPDSSPRGSRSRYRPVRESSGGEVAAPPWRIPSDLPPGLDEALLAETRCRDGWIGVASAKADVRGSVIEVDSSGIRSGDRCRRAIDALLRLSFVNNESILAPFSFDQVVMVRPDGAPLCFDEDEPSAEPIEGSAVGSRCARVGEPGVEPPKVVNRVQPRFPQSVRHRGMSVAEKVVVVATISRAGCVRNVRLKEQSRDGAFNSAVLVAVSQWEFEPGTLNGVPVDVVFELTTTFRR